MNSEVKTLQTWLNNRYGSNSSFVRVDEDGIVGYKTYKALVRAVQIELNVSPVDGLWGDGTSAAFPALSINSDSSNEKTSRLIYILQGGFFCKGIHPGALDGVFGESTKAAVETLETQAGLTTPTGVASGMIMKALLNTDAYTLLSGGDTKIRTIQQALNREYNAYIGLIPCDGIVTKTTSRAMIMALQVEHKKQYSTVTLDGKWGPDTMKKCPTLQRYGTITNRKYVYLLQYALYINGYDPNGFDGGFGAGVQSAAKKFQAFVGLTADGIVGPQTWASLMVSYGDPDRACQGADCMKPLTEHTAAMLAKDGRTAIGRYIVGGPNKKLTLSELDIIHRAGLRVIPIFQRSGRDVSEFNFYRGRVDASDAIAALNELQFPSNPAVYFAIDYDVDPDDIPTNIAPYFRGILSQLGDMTDEKYIFSVGVYAPRYVCTYLHDAGLTDYSFVSDMSSGFMCNLGYKLPANWAFDQIKNAKIVDDDCTLEVDNDVICASRNTSVTVIPKALTNSAEYNLVNTISSALGLRLLLAKQMFKYQHDEEVCLRKTSSYEVYFKISSALSFELADGKQNTMTTAIVNGSFADPTWTTTVGNMSATYPVITASNFPSIAAAVNLGEIKISIGTGTLSTGKPAAAAVLSISATPDAVNGLSESLVVSLKILISGDEGTLVPELESNTELSYAERELAKKVVPLVMLIYTDYKLAKKAIVLAEQVLEGLIRIFEYMLPGKYYGKSINELNDIYSNNALTD